MKDWNQKELLFKQVYNKLETRKIEKISQEQHHPQFL